MRLAFFALLGLGVARAEASPSASDPSSSRSAAMNGAAALYYQAQYATALDRLEALLAEGSWKRRDSLVLYQYLGMASARLGRDSSASGYFTALLGMDSLFRFPRNEDPAVLAAFKRAREGRAAAASAPPAAAAVSPDSVTPAIPPEPALASPAAVRSTVEPMTPPEGPAGARVEAVAPRAPPSGSRGRMNLAYGAIPFGGGWLLKRRLKPGTAMAFLQVAGLVVSGYASERQSREQNDRFGLKNGGEVSSAESWQWAQRISVSVAVGTYLFSIFASAGE